MMFHYFCTRRSYTNYQLSLTREVDMLLNAHRGLVRISRPRCSNFQHKRTNAIFGRQYQRVVPSSPIKAHPLSKAADLVIIDGKKIDIADKNVKQILDELWIVPEFISSEEESLLVAEINPMFKKKRYIDTHWDGVITGYKEIEKMMWKPENAKVIKKVRMLLPEDTKWRPAVHVLDLAANGPIDAHIDSVTASGGILAGLSLCSSCVMTLKRPKFPIIQLRLEPRTLYVMQGDIRYEYTHEIPANQSVWGDEIIPRERRISIMFRDELPRDSNDDDGVRLFKLTEDGAISM